MERLLFALGQLRGYVVRSDDDYVDKLNYRYTTFLLCFFAIFISAKQVMGDPITCWYPAEFKDNYEDFANKFCWVSNTYHVPIAIKDIPEETEPRYYIGYYQWVSMFMVVQAFMFYLPCRFWRSLNSKTGLDVDNIIQSAKSLQRTNYTENQEKTLMQIVKHVDRYLKDTKGYREQQCLSICKHHLSRDFFIVCGSRRFGNYLVALYIVMKIMYLLNAVGQLLILNVFLGSAYNLYGYQVIKKFVEGGDWSASSVFPRVTMCDFSIRDFNNIRQYTVQCVLHLNFFNEKLYILLWFWMVMVVAANVINLLTWVTKTLTRHEQIRFIKHHLKDIDREDRMDWRKSNRELRRRIVRFVTKYLKKDGVLLLKLVQINSNGLVVSEIIAELFSHFSMSSVSNLETTDSAEEEF